MPSRNPSHSAKAKFLSEFFRREGDLSKGGRLSFGRFESLDQYALIAWRDHLISRNPQWEDSRMYCVTHNDFIRCEMFYTVEIFFTHRKGLYSSDAYERSDHLRDALVCFDCVLRQARLRPAVSLWQYPEYTKPAAGGRSGYDDDGPDGYGVGGFNWNPRHYWLRFIYKVALHNPSIRLRTSDRWDSVPLPPGIIYVGLSDSVFDASSIAVKLLPTWDKFIRKSAVKYRYKVCYEIYNRGDSLAEICDKANRCLPYDPELKLPPLRSLQAVNKAIETHARSIGVSVVRRRRPQGRANSTDGNSDG